MVDLDNNSASHQLVDEQLLVQFWWLQTWVRQRSCRLLAWARIEFTVEPKDCLICDVRISSLEVDLRVPGNRDEFPFSQAEWSLPS